MCNTSTTTFDIFIDLKIGGASSGGEPIGELRRYIFMKESKLHADMTRSFYDRQNNQGTKSQQNLEVPYAAKRLIKQDCIATENA